jgi:dTDP-4-amino-4,6-dideoxygalactose transaminase
VGALTELGTFSFQQFKTLTTGEGGMVMSNDEQLIERAYSYHHIGRIKGRPFYEHHVPASNLRMTEWQGAIGLAQLQRFGEQTERREQRSRYLAAGLQRLNEQGIGIAPLVRDPRVTRWGFYMWHLKFLPERWDGVSRDQFLRALRAEGVPCGTGHTQPLYQNPLFQDAEHAFGRTGFPVRGEPYGRTMDFAGISCPQTERIFTTEAVSLGHALFLGPQSDMDAILTAIEKIWQNRDTLRPVPVAG